LAVVLLVVSAGDIGRSYLRVFSDSSFDLLASYQLGSQEIPTAITSMSFGSGSTADKPDSAAAGAAAGGSGSSSEDSQAYYIVGTAVIKPNVSVSQAICCEVFGPGPGLFGVFEIAFGRVPASSCLLHMCSLVLCILLAL
jgi:hypothetical protein